MKPLFSKIAGGKMPFPGIFKKKSFPFLFVFYLSGLSAQAQPILFDFDNAPVYSPLPISLTVSGLTADFFGTGQGYSIQNANVMGFTPAGFSGLAIYPSSVFQADLLVRFNQPLTSFSILYACQELGCDDAATMRVTAYLNGSFAGTSTRTATYPGTWPSDTLSCTIPSGFDSVVIHYDSPPPTCQDYGVIFMADQMLVSTLSTGFSTAGNNLQQLTVTNPVSESATIGFTLLRPEKIRLAVYNPAGQLIAVPYDGLLISGRQELKWTPRADLSENCYFMRIQGESFIETVKIIVQHP